MMRDDEYNGYGPLEEEQRAAGQQRVAVYLGKVMGWMCVGLLTTFAVALFCTSIPRLLYTFTGTNAVFAVMITQLGLVVLMGAAMRKVSPAVATAMFMLYAAFTGVTFTALFVLFETASLIFVFGVAAFMFVAMAAYGLATKRDLTRIGALALFGLIGIILAGIVNLFIGSGPIDFAITVIGIVVFIALTAYDTQRIKAIYLDAVASGYDEEGPEIRKLAIYGALNLYLDFINLFLKLLRLLGRRRS